MPPPLSRTAFLVEYDGTGFAGLQRQENGPSIQAEFERVAGILGVGEPWFRASGRTDAGVHAMGQVVTLEVPELLAGPRARDAFNWHLPRTIRVRRSVLAPTGFDPRTHARMRTYRYRLATTPSVNPLWRHMVGITRARRLDLAAMREGAAAFIGRREMKEWRSAMCQAKRTVLTIDRTEVSPLVFSPAAGGVDDGYEFVFEARSFLHHQVRLMVGALILVGRGKITAEELASHLAEGTRPEKVAMAEAKGLCLERVRFAEGWEVFGEAISSSRTPGT